MFQSTEEIGSGGEDAKPPDCLQFLGALRKCVSSFHQFHQFYIYGQIDNCQDERTDLKNCFLWRTKSVEAKESLQKSMEKAERRKQFVDKPSSAVWEFRENPAEDWKKRK